MMIDMPGRRLLSVPPGLVMLQAGYLVCVPATQLPHLTLKLARAQGHMLTCIISALHNVTGLSMVEENAMAKKVAIGQV